MGKLIIYRFLNESGRSLYVGKAKNLNREIKAIVKADVMADNQLAQMTKEISYIKVKGEAEAEFIRLHFIQAFKPPYNDKKEARGTKQPYKVTLEDIKWENYRKPEKPKISLFNKLGYLYAGNSTKDKIKKATPEGYPILKTKDINTYSLELERRETAIQPNVANRKYCRYIILSGMRYFYISDLLDLLDSSFGKKAQKELLGSGLLGKEDILMLDEEGTFRRNPEKLKRTVLGSERWLELKVLQSVSIREYKGQPGWLPDTQYLYAGLLDKDPKVAPEYKDLPTNLDEVENLVWIEQRMKEERGRVAAADLSRDYLSDIREMLLEVAEYIAKRGVNPITEEMSPIALTKPEEILNIQIKTQKYKSAQSRDLLSTLSLWETENRQQYGVLNATCTGDGLETTYRIQAGFFQGDNFSDLLANNYDHLVQCASIIDKGEVKLRTLSNRYEAIKIDRM